MPLWEFVCDDCEMSCTMFRQTGSRPPAPTCDKCGAEMKYRISPGAIIFKGYGWTNKGEKPARNYSVKTEVVDEDSES